MGIHQGLLGAAKNGNHTAQHLVGLDLFFGQNEIPKDEEQGILWMGRAAEGGEMLSQEFMGKILAKGHASAKKSPKNSVDFF